MRQFKLTAAPFLVPGFFALMCAFALAPAHAQGPVRIIYPQEGQDVRGEVTVRYEGLPPGGYAIIRIDDQFKQASAQEYAVFDTISDRNTFTRGDGQYKLNITVLRPGGAQVGTDTVTFNVANSKVDVGGESVKLVHWQTSDILRDSVERYRVFAESNAVITGGAEAGGAAGGGGGGDAGGAATETYIPAPLDWQVAALMRRQVRNVAMFDGSANIATAVQESFERQRKSEAGGAGGAEAAAPTTRRRGAPPVSTVPVKAPWNEDEKGRPLWNKAGETGKYFVKMIQPNGTEINATRKAPTIAIADLLPTFPDAAVRPGSTWETNMTILGDLSSRKGVNVVAPITFTAYDTILTPGGISRRCAKLESRFRLPENKAKEIAANLGSKTEGAAAGGGGAAAPIGGGEAGAEDALLPEDIDVARTDVARVLWFDMDRNQVVRSEDVIKSYFEIPPAAAEGGGAAPAPAMEGGEAAAPAEPTKINYNLKVTTWFDDRIPPPNTFYTGGLGTAHSRDSVNDPGISRITQPGAK